MNMISEQLVICVKACDALGLKEIKRKVFWLSADGDTGIAYVRSVKELVG